MLDRCYFKDYLDTVEPLNCKRRKPLRQCRYRCSRKKTGFKGEQISRDLNGVHCTDIDKRWVSKPILQPVLTTVSEMHELLQSGVGGVAT